MSETSRPAAPATRQPHGPFSLTALVVAGGTILIDQAAKWIVEAQLPFGMAFDMLPFLALYRTYNSGIAFSLLAGLGPVALVGVALVICAAVMLLWARTKPRSLWTGVAFALIVGGALGNLIDRIAYGHVIDYLLLHWQGWTLFVFNLADAALTIGPVLLIALTLFEKREG